MSVMTRTALTDVLAQTIESNAEILRLLDPERFRLLLENLRAESTTALKPATSEDAWDDLEFWIAENRRQDIEQIDS